MGHRIDTDHDSAITETTSSASVVAVIASLEPQNDHLNSHPRKSNHARRSLASKSLSQHPRFHEGHRFTQSEGSSVTTEEMALLRSASRSTTSSAKSSSSRSHSCLGSSTGPTSVSHSTNSTPRETSAEQSGQQPGGNKSADASFASTCTLSPRARRKLLRSARKVGYLLGETPVLCTSMDLLDARRNPIDTSELDVHSPASPFLPGSDRKHGRTNSLNTTTRSQPNAEVGLGMYGDYASAILAPHQYSASDVDHTTPPMLNRVPPVLKLDCSLVGRSTKRALQGSSDDVAPDADAQSFISTTTTTTIAGDLFSPAKGSPASTIGIKLTRGDGAKENLREMRRSRVAKLSRHLGEHVPSELVFPVELETEKVDQYVLVSYEKESPVSPLAGKSLTPERTDLESPTRSSSLRRRKRKSLHLDTCESPGVHDSAPSAAASSTAESVPAATTSAKSRLVRKLSRSNSARLRARKKQASPAISRSSTDAEMENVQNHPTSAPAGQTIHEVVVGADVNVKQKDKEKEDENLEPRIPLNDAQKQLNVRRAQKMLSVFGEAPPNTLVAVKSKCESPSTLGRSVMGGRRFQRHSVSSITTAASSLIMDLREPATFDSPVSPVSPVTPRPSVLDGQSCATPKRASKDGAKLPTSLSPRRRASLSALPGTPPPFEQYFDPPSPPPSVSPTYEEQRTLDCGRAVDDNLKPPQTPATDHSPPSSSGSSAFPLTPLLASIRQGDPGEVFRERRLRAAKLSRFFGVGYADLYPALAGAGEDDVQTKRSFDSLRAARALSIDKEIVKVKEKERKLEAARTRVSVTVQREVDPGTERALLSSPSSSSLSSAAEEKEKQGTVSPRLAPAYGQPSRAGSKSSRKDSDVTSDTVGCYGGLSFSTGLTRSRRTSTRRRGGTPVADNGGNVNTHNARTKVGSGFGLSVFSLGRQSRRLGSVDNAGSVPSDATLARKGSVQSRRGRGRRALTLGERRSMLAQSSCGELGNASGNRMSITATDLEITGPRVRVGEKIADVNEVMAKLRELR